MNINDARISIINRLSALAPLSAPQIDLNDNRSYRFIVDGSDTEWIRLTISPNDGSQISLGGDGVATKFDVAGIAQAQVFTEIATGEFRNDALCDLIWNEFVKQTGDRPLYYGGRQAGGDVRIVQVGRDSTWWQQNVIIPFWFERCVI